MRVIQRTTAALAALPLAASVAACGSSPDRYTETDAASIQAKGRYDTTALHHPDSTTGLPGRTGSPAPAGEGGARTPVPPQPR